MFEGPHPGVLKVGRLLVGKEYKPQRAAEALTCQAFRQVQANGHARSVVVGAGRTGRAVVMSADHDALWSLTAAPAVLLQLAPAAAVLVTFSLRQREGRWRVFTAALAVFLGVQALALLWAGPAYVEQVYWYQLAKPRVSGEGLRQLGSVLATDAGLFFVAGCGALVTTVFGGRAGRCRVALGLAWIAATWIVLGSRPRVFRFYFQPAFFPAAVLAGLGVQCLVAEFLRNQSRLRRAVAVGAGLVMGWSALCAGAFATPIFAPERARELAELQREYIWTDAPGLSAGVNRLVRTLFFKGGRRQPGDAPNRFTAYLWQRSRWLDTLPDLVAAVQRVTLFRRLVGRAVRGARSWGADHGRRR